MYIRIKVTPAAKSEEIKKISENEFEISVREKAERGEANKKVCEIIQKYFGDPAGGTKIINGHHSVVKLLKVGKD